MASKRQNPLQRLGARIKAGMSQVDTAINAKMPERFTASVNARMKPKEKK